MRWPNPTHSSTSRRQQKIETQKMHIGPSPISEHSPKERPAPPTTTASAVC